MIKILPTVSDPWPKARNTREKSRVFSFWIRSLALPTGLIAREGPPTLGFGRGDTSTSLTSVQLNAPSCSRPGLRRRLPKLRSAKSTRRRIVCRLALSCPQSPERSRRTDGLGRPWTDPRRRWSHSGARATPRPSRQERRAGPSGAMEAAGRGAQRHRATRGIPREAWGCALEESVPGATRTHDLPLRRRLLYPAELPGPMGGDSRGSP